MPELHTDEKWLPVRGYEGLYEVSNLSRIRSLDMVKRGPYGSTFIAKGRILRQVATKGSGKHKARPVVSLCNKGVRTTQRVHKVVAIAWVPGWFEGAIVNHLDNNAFNNLPSNLEWTTYRGNSAHAVSIGAIGPNSKYRIHNVDTGVVYDSISKASRESGIAYSTLNRMLKGISRNTTSLILKAA